MVLIESDQVGFRGHVDLANRNVGHGGVNHKGFEQRPASGVRAETSHDKPADKENPMCAGMKIGHRTSRERCSAAEQK